MFGAISVTVESSVTASSEFSGGYPAVDDAANVGRIVNGNVYRTRVFVDDDAGDSTSGEVGSHLTELPAVQICHFRDRKNCVGDDLGRVDLAVGVGGTH
ncbi:Uncharacterised protein [Mycobacteroides abscessus subsp. abscessus]|nr:Uncharacterised protein [Mycobacteroides abscessus subsp. abscessus]